MKKNIIIIISGLLITILMFILGGLFKNNNDKNTIKVAEVTHSAFYTPFYVAIEKGFFEENNIDIDLILTSGANNVVAAVLSGDVQIGLCGPEATIYVYNENQKDYVQTFAGLTKRDGQFIVSRTPIENFKLSDLENKEVLGGRIGGMPIVNFYTALKNQNITKVNVNNNIDFANLTSAFISGTGDFVNLFELNVKKKTIKAYLIILVIFLFSKIPSILAKLVIIVSLPVDLVKAKAASTLGSILPLLNSLFLIYLLASSTFITSIAFSLSVPKLILA